MLPLIPLAVSLVPELVRLLAGDTAGTVAASVASVVAEVTGTSDPVAAQAKLAADPAAAANLRIRLAELAIEAQKVQNEEQERKRQAELEAMKADFQNTSDARAKMVDLASVGNVLSYAPAIVSVIVTSGLFLFLLAIAFFPPPQNETIAQVVNITVGALTAGFATVINFWLGSSQGSRNKDVAAAQVQVVQAEQTRQIQVAQANRTQEAIQGLQNIASKVVTNAPAPAPVAAAAPVAQAVTTVSSPVGEAPPVQRAPAPVPAKPAAPGLIAEVLPSLSAPHKFFAEGASWALTPQGISVDGSPPRCTAGVPSTVRTIWQRYGADCLASAKNYGVPVELIVATIATESGGDPNARRAEPQIGDESVGLMQTLSKTAGSALGRPNLRADDLMDPRLSIEAGTAYIAQQRTSTHFDPPLVAAAYNAGSLRRDPAEANQWKLVCFPLGTGRHVDTFTAWFGDAMRVSAEDGWATQAGAPSFAAAMSAGTATV
jgi:soluble lytic murein transglycosylase-like protein